jgi:hypothetical protein
MLTVISRSIVWLVIVIMTCECISSAMVSFPQSSNHLSVQKKSSKPSIFETILSVKSEEETEKNEQERDKVFPIEIADFSQIARALSIHFTPVVNLTPLLLSEATGRKLFELFCVLII